ncbi:MAG: hypothetical protein J6Y78_16535 [Paludibacteraceae bacterium]|nr:hypothetical protein [Paludibacteraceae bacterium]
MAKAETTNRVIKILMDRDDMTKAEAIKYFNDVRADIQDAIRFGDANLVEALMADNLGLEMDYIFDIL